MAFNRKHIHAAKITPSDVAEIRRLYAHEGWTQGRLSRKFRLSVGQIGRIVRGESWQQYDQPTHDQEIEFTPPGELPDAETIAASMAKLDSLMGEPIAPLPEMPLPADIAARMAAYGVRPPTPKELIEQLASPVHSSRSGSEPSKPVIQAQSAVVDAAAKGGRDASAARCQTPECRYDAGHSGRCKSEQGFYLSAASGGDDAAINVLDQVTEESAK